MIALKANSGIKAIFRKTIKIMGENVTWTDTIVINNNNIILVGKVRSLVFNFDTRRVFSTIIDFPAEQFKSAPVISTTLMENALNIILYVFGKWGQIKGLTVEKNFDQLNLLIGRVLTEIEVKADLTGETFRFYKNGIAVTYEDVIQLALNEMDPKSKPDEQVENNDSNTSSTAKATEADSTSANSQDAQNIPGAEISDDSHSKFKIGLWHNMVWTGGQYSFEKISVSKEERMKSRLGKGFYLSSYQCPLCNSKLYMVVFPVGKEFKIETADEPVMLARSYTCNNCNSFFTPKPHKMIMDGDVYALLLNDDQPAYTDYVELLGSKGAKTSNCNFNLYESEYFQKPHQKAENLNNICENLEELSDAALLTLKDKMESHFFPDKSVAKNEKKINNELGRRSLLEPDIDGENSLVADTNSILKKQKKERSKTLHTPNFFKLAKFANSIKSKSSTLESNSTSEASQPTASKSTEDSINSSYPSASEYKEENINQRTSILQHITGHKNNTHDTQGITTASSTKDTHDAGFSGNTTTTSDQFSALPIILSYAVNDNSADFETAATMLSPSLLDRLKAMISEESSLPAEKKQHYTKLADNYRFKSKQKELLQKAISNKNSNFHDLLSIREEVKNDDSPDSLKNPVLDFFDKLLQQRGKKELDAILNSVPSDLSKNQYYVYKDKVSSYQDTDTSMHLKKLDAILDTSETAQIKNIIKNHKKDVTNRESISELYQTLQEQGFEERNIGSILTDLHVKIRNMDEIELNLICPDPATLSYKEGLDAYDKISTGNFLPELKFDLLKMIDKRLIKMKTDECEQLVKKLTKDMNWTPENYPGIYLNDVRQMLKGSTLDQNTLMINNAKNTYASFMGKYEYPILVCDSSGFANGKEGFILTPDHLYYKSFLYSGILNVQEIENIYSETGLMKKGLYVNYHNVGVYKITGALKSRGFQTAQLQQLATKLNDFVNYLKEKPESRDITYMAKETHAVKCCYRCGFVYSTGDICPKCGNRNND